jgi:hypothetical protein
MRVLVGALSACVAVPPTTERVGSSPSAGALRPPPEAPVVFDLPSLDERSVSAPAFRGKPAVLAFLVTDSLAGQGEAAILATLAAEDRAESARYAFVAVEPDDRRELVVSFLRFFAEKTRGKLLGAMADKDTLLGQGPFGDVGGVTVVVLDKAGRVVLRKTGVVPASEITRALAGATM